MQSTTNNFEIIKFHFGGSKGNMMKVLAQKRKNINKEIKYSPEKIIDKVRYLNEFSKKYKKSIRYYMNNTLTIIVISIKILLKQFLKIINFKKEIS